MNLVDFVKVYDGNIDKVKLIMHYAVENTNGSRLSTTVGSFYDADNEYSMSLWKVKKISHEHGQIVVEVL